MKRDEQKTHIACVHLIRQAYPSVIPFAIMNGGYAVSARQGALFKAMGLLPGVPDLGLILPEGRIAWVEFKAEGGRVSPEQHAIHAILRGLGHRVSVCRSVADLIETLAAWQIPSRIQGVAA